MHFPQNKSNNPALMGRAKNSKMCLKGRQLNRRPFFIPMKSFDKFKTVSIQFFGEQ